MENWVAENGELTDGLTDSWGEWGWLEDDVPHGPDVPPPPKVRDAREGEVEVPLPRDGGGWRITRDKVRRS